MKIIKALVTIMFLLALLPPNIIANTNYTIIVNDQHVTLQDPLFIESGRLYVPVRFIGEHLGADVDWEHVSRTVKLKTSIDDTITFFVDKKKVQLNENTYSLDVSPLIRNDRTYLPVRHVGEFLHMEVKWLNNANKIYLTSVPLYEVKMGDSLAGISKQYGTTTPLLKERNQLKDGTLNPGTLLKVVIPQTLENKGDIDLLAKLIQAEAEGEPFKAQVAIGNVILNRVANPKFPNSIEGVILEAGQFTPVSTGRINQVVPSQTAKEAASRALHGEAPVGESLYFFNPNKTNNVFLGSREVVVDLGNHRFTK